MKQINSDFEKTKLSVLVCLNISIVLFVATIVTGAIFYYLSPNDPIFMEKIIIATKNTEMLKNHTKISYIFKPLIFTILPACFGIYFLTYFKILYFGSVDYKNMLENSGKLFQKVTSKNIMIIILIGSMILSLVGAWGEWSNISVIRDVFKI